MEKRNRLRLCLMLLILLLLVLLATGCEDVARTHIEFTDGAAMFTIGEPGQSGVFALFITPSTGHRWLAAQGKLGDGVAHAVYPLYGEYSYTIYWLETGKNGGAISVDTLVAKGHHFGGPE